MTKKLTLLIVLCLPVCFLSCKKQTETPVEHVKTGGNTVVNPSVIDTAKLIVGWWQPENFLVQNKVYFGADKFFYIDSLQGKTPLAGTWSFENNVIRCKTTYGNHIIKFEIASVTADKLYLKMVGVGVLQPFNKSADAAITSGALSTIAGTGVAGYNGDGIPATSAALQGAYDIVTDNAGNIYFCDGGARIRKINIADGKISTFAGTGVGDISAVPNNVPAASAQILARYLAIDGANNIYFAYNYRIFKISASNGYITFYAGGGTLTEQGTPAKQAYIGAIGGMTATDNGDLYITDYIAKRIKKITAATQTMTTLVGTEGQPVGITTDKLNNLYFIEGHSVKMMANMAKPVTIFAGLNYTNADEYIAGDGGRASKAMFKGPYGLAVSAKGDVFVSDALDYTVRKINFATRIITKVAGTGGFQGAVASGIHATAYPLFGPHYLAVDPAGNNLYISSEKYRIHKVAIN
jgi:hypothetical protein